VQFGYGLNYLIDIAHAIIVDVEPTPARTYDEVASTKTMLDRTEQRFGLKPKRLAADTAYGTGRFLDWLVGHRIIPAVKLRCVRNDREDRGNVGIIRSPVRASIPPDQLRHGEAQQNRLSKPHAAAFAEPGFRRFDAAPTQSYRPRDDGRDRTR
jgi:hypothetical protein